MKKIISIVALGTLLSTGSLYAGGNVSTIVPIAPIVSVDTNPFYVGAGLLWAGASRDCFLEGCVNNVRLKDTTWGGIVRAGYDYNQYIGIEVRALKATVESDWAETTHYGIYLKPMMPVGEQMNIYALLGYGHTEVETACTTMQNTFEYDGFSYGVGLEYDLSDRASDDEGGEYSRPFDGQGDQEKGWGLWIDYQNLMNNEGPDNFKSNIISVGVTYDF